MVSKKEKSLKLNMLLNAIKGFMGIVFPLISFPYISKVLGVDNVGKYNFAVSIINYFMLLAALGIVTYAIREGAKLREDKEMFEHFANEMFSINLLATAVSYFLFGILLLVVPKFQQYREVLIILSLQIIFKTIGVEWIYSVYEEYAYITVRSIMFQIISLALMFIFVRTQNDLLMYTGIVVVASVGSNILNYFHSKKYCNLRIVKTIDWKKHFRPVMVLFAMNITVTVYVSFGTTILGFLCGDYIVGIYAVSSKVYTIVKTILSAVLIVSIPRLSAYWGNGDTERFNTIATDIYNTLLTIVIPCVFGIILLREPIILLISDSAYIAATSSLTWLGIALFFCMGAWFWGQCILVPMNRENVVFKVTVVSALINIAVNLLMIPIWKENGAAIGVVLAECVSFVWCAYEGRRCITLKGIGNTMLKVFVGCVVMGIFILLLEPFYVKSVLHIVVTVISAMLLYFLVEILLKNNAVRSTLKAILRRR